MRFLKIMLKEIKHSLRNKRASILNLLLPIVLIAILGTALSGNYSSTSSQGSIDVIYTNNGDKAYEGLITSLGGIKDLGIKFTKGSNREDSISKVKNRNYACYVEFNDGNVQIYSNDKETISAAKVEAIISSSLQKYKLKVLLTNYKAGTEDKAYVDQVSLTGPKSPKAIDYYSVTMITMIIGYACMRGLEIFNVERSRKTGARMLYAPIRKTDIFLGKIMGCLFVNFLQYLILIFLTKLIFKSYWGEHLWIVILIALAETIMFFSLGTMIASIVKNYTAGRQILNVAVGVITFLGGSYFPIEDSGKFIEAACNLSPVKWTNEAMFQVIYRNDFSYITGAILISGVLSIIFIMISAIYMRKEGFLNE